MKKNIRKGAKTMTVATKVQKWGNSLAVRIPTAVADRVSIQQGTEIEINVIDDQEIMIVPIKVKPKKYTLEELLKQCKPENRHEEIDFGIEGDEII